MSHNKQKCVPSLQLFMTLPFHTSLSTNKRILILQLTVQSNVAFHLTKRVLRYAPVRSQVVSLHRFDG
jgi:hypothetical protein